VGSSCELDAGTTMTDLPSLVDVRGPWLHRPPAMCDAHHLLSAPTADRPL
jgi:hypothetical protein